MTWLIWRQHRKQFLIFGIILVLFTALAIPTGIHFWNEYQQALLTCAQFGTCDQLSDVLFQPWYDGFLFKLMMFSSVVVPFLLGLFVGAPLIAREYGEGTNKLVWTQSVSRRRWLTVKMVWILAASAVYGAAFAILVTWWSRTANALYLSRFHDLIFDSQGIVPVAYALFAVALGIAVGAWFKKTVAAMAVTLGMLVVLQAGVPILARPHYEAPVTYDAPITTSNPNPSPGNAIQLLNRAQIDNQGHVLNIFDPPAQCTNVPIDRSQAQGQGQDKGVAGISVNGGPMISFACLSSLGYHWSIKYQPADRYWPFQGIETAIYLALAAMAIGATYWVVLKHDA